MIKVAVVGFLIGIAPAMAQDDLVADGKVVWVLKCQRCHVIGEPTKFKKPGPNLNDLFGRKPGSLPGYDRYSEQLIAWGQDKVWDEATLTGFLHDPQGVVLNTKMAILGLQKDEEIKAVLAYLATFDSDGMTVAQDAERSVERGRYLVTIANCNDCHTAGYFESLGAVPESEWLMGSPVGFRGPWGTSYAINLRNGMSMTKDERWLEVVRSGNSWPPMPWYNIQKMSDTDLLSILDFVKSLGRAGTEMPKVVYPGKDPGGLYISYPGAP